MSELNNFKIVDGFVQVPVKAWRVMRKKADASEQLEDAADAAALKNALANQEEYFHGDVLKAILSGENPVKVYRKYRGFTQAQLGEKAGVAQNTIADIENGRKDGSVKTIKAIAGALGVDIDDLVD